MPISFKPLARLIPLSRLKHQRIVGGATYDMIRSAVDNPITGGVSISAIDAICAYLGVQPGDVIEYVPDGAERAVGAATGPVGLHGDAVAVDGPDGPDEPREGEHGAQTGRRRSRRG